MYPPNAPTMIPINATIKRSPSSAPLPIGRIVFMFSPCMLCEASSTGLSIAAVQYVQQVLCKARRSRPARKFGRERISQASFPARQTRASPSSIRYSTWVVVMVESPRRVRLTELLGEPPLDLNHRLEVPFYPALVSLQAGPAVILSNGRKDAVPDRFVHDLRPAVRPDDGGLKQLVGPREAHSHVAKIRSEVIALETVRVHQARNIVLANLRLRAACGGEPKFVADELDLADLHWIEADQPSQLPTTPSRGREVAVTVRAEGEDEFVAGSEAIPPKLSHRVDLTRTTHDSDARIEPSVRLDESLELSEGEEVCAQP